METVFVVCLKEGDTHDFMKVFQSKKGADRYVINYSYEYENIGDGLVVFEEELNE